MTTRRFGLIALAVAAVALAVVPGAALAKSKDRNRDRIPDRWEKKHHLSLKVKQTNKDQDKDGLRNLSEYRNHTDPRDSDSDDDGLEDGAEVRSRNDPNDPDSDDDGVEDGKENAGKIVSFDGMTLTIELGDGSTVSGLVVAGFTEVECDDHSDEDDGEDCGIAALHEGAVVHEAELELRNGAAVFEEIELVVAA